MYLLYIKTIKLIHIKTILDKTHLMYMNPKARM